VPESKDTSRKKRPVLAQKTRTTLSSHEPGVCVCVCVCVCVGVCGCVYYVRVMYVYLSV
jgi:hypothetical protein